MGIEYDAIRIIKEFYIQSTLLLDFLEIIEIANRAILTNLENLGSENAVIDTALLNVVRPISKAIYNVNLTNQGEIKC